MKKSHGEKLVGILHNTHMRHGVLTSVLEDGTGSIRVCIKGGNDVTDGDLVIFDGYTLVEEEKHTCISRIEDIKPQYIRYAQINFPAKDCSTTTKEVDVFILRKAELRGNAIAINKNPRIKGTIITVRFENQLTADRFITPSGYKIWVEDEQWEQTRVIKENYRWMRLGRVKSWELSNPIIRNEVGNQVIKSGIILYKVATVTPVPTVNILCKEITRSETFTVGLEWEWDQILGLLPGAVVFFKNITYFPSRKTLFDTKGIFVCDTTNSYFDITELSTKEYYDTLKSPKVLPRFSTNVLLGRPKMTFFEFNKLKPMSECVICCNIAVVKHFHVYSSVPYFRGALSAVFDDGTDVWHGRIENEVLEKLLNLTETKMGNSEWNSRINIIIRGDRVTNVEPTDLVSEARFLLEGL